MTGVLITFQYDEASFDRGRIEGVASSTWRRSSTTG